MQDLGILLIDMQEKFIFGFNPFVDEKEKSRLVEAQIRFLEVTKKKQIPVVVLEYKNRGKTIQKIQDALEGTENYSLEKSSPNGFVNPELNSLLKEKGIRRLILTGIYSDDCVLRTAEGAKKDFEIFTCKELMNLPYESSVRWYQTNTNYSKTIGELFTKI